MQTLPLPLPRDNTESIALSHTQTFSLPEKRFPVEERGDLGTRLNNVSAMPMSRRDSILVPIALFASLSRQGLGTRNEGLRTQMISSPRL